jgi:peptidoglycan hydrolase-like protein with peptidoglycan-binding domain
MRRFDRSQEETGMYKAILAALAATVLFAPAVAQQSNVNGPSRTGQEALQRTRPIAGASQGLAGEAISPRLLTSGQVRNIQRALEARGANPIRVDGEWGPDVEAALRAFQKSKNIISQNGELDSLTLMALGLDPLGFGLPDVSETTGEAARDRVPPEDMPEQPLLGDGEQREQDR